MPVARFSYQRVGEQTQLIKLSLLNKVLSICGLTGLFHTLLATDQGKADAQPRNKDLGTQPRFSISVEGAEGQRDTVGGHSSSGFVMLLCLLSRGAPGTGNLFC